MGMSRSTTIVRGIFFKQDSGVFNIEIDECMEGHISWFGSGEYMSGVVVGRKVLQTDDSIAELNIGDSLKEHDADIVTTANAIALAIRSEKTYTESDIKIYYVPRYS